MPEFGNLPAAAQENTGVFKGQVWEWRTVHAPDAIRCLVTRVAKDGSWADLRCVAANGSAWSKRQKLSFPDTFELTPEYVP